MPEPPDVGPLSPREAREIVRRVLEHGVLSFSGHASDEMAADDLSSADCINVLRAGVYRPPELEKGTWRYRVETTRICVVVAIPNEDRVRVVTAWRK